MSNSISKVISFSGIDGCGKSTQIDLLADMLAKNSSKYRKIWARPGSTPFMLAAKRIIRFLFPSLPKPGRSIKRTQLINTNSIGLIWKIASLIDLIYLYGIKTRILKLFGYSIIFDRYIDDALIDFYLLSSRKDLFYKIAKNLLHTFCDSADEKFLLVISRDESIKRCQQKYDPYPDTDTEREIRYLEYSQINNFKNYTILNGLESVDKLYSQINSQISS